MNRFLALACDDNPRGVVEILWNRGLRMIGNGFSCENEKEPFFPMPSRASMNHLKAFFRRAKDQWKSMVVKAVAAFFILSFVSVLVFRFIPVFITPLMVIRSVSSVFGDHLVGIEKDWVSLEDISPVMKVAVIKTEDSKFYEHGGFDFEAIEKAYHYNKTHLRKKGASTISQQTAKNVFLWPSRNWLRKGLEAYFTVLIELTWPKERILEVYLNVIELGPGVYGVEAASQKYFNQSSKNLNTYQAARIAAVLPNPNRFKIDRPSNYILKRQRRIMARPAPPFAQN